MKVGIDLGTTNSVMTRFTEDGETEVIENDRGHDKTPSVVLIEENAEDGEKVTVGRNAESKRRLKPDRVLARTKQDIHKEERVIYEVGDEEYDPIDAAGYILGHMRKEGEDNLGEDIEGAVITVPYDFANEGRKATEQAGMIAGFEEVMEIINEPTAACLSYVNQNEDIEGNILVYDLGGGTFDATLVELDSGIIDVVSTEGDGELGGEDFDDELYAVVRQKIIDEGAPDPEEEHPSVKADLMTNVKDLKHELSDRPEGTIVYTEGEGAEINVKREEFEEAIKEDYIDDTIEMMDDLFEKDSVKEAGIMKEDIDNILLVGGSTRIPLVREEVEEFFGQEPKLDADPDTVVARGAAIQAANYRENIDGSDLPNLSIRNVLSHNLGLGVKERGGGNIIFDLMLEEDTNVPEDVTEGGYSNPEASEKIRVPVWEKAEQGDVLNEDEEEQDADKLGQLILNPPGGYEVGEMDIEVTFVANHDGTLTVEAVERDSGQTVEARLEGVGLTAEALKEKAGTISEGLDMETGTAHLEEASDD